MRSTVGQWKPGGRWLRPGELRTPGLVEQRIQGRLPGVRGMVFGGAGSRVVPLVVENVRG